MDIFMKTITRVKKVIQISSVPEFNSEYDHQAEEFSESIFKLTRGLYRYEPVWKWDVRGDLDNDQLMQEFDIATEVATYKADEVWVFGCLKSETAMGGAKAFWLGGVPVKGAAIVHRRFPFMRFGIEPLLLTFAKRVEATLYHAYRDYPPTKNMWERYIRDFGTVARPPTGNLGSYRNEGFWDYSADWITYPELHERPHYTTNAWDGTLEGYLKWWLGNLPQGLHKTDGIHDNWWHAIMNLDLIR
jgi:hypothetical protein